MTCFRCTEVLLFLLFLNHVCTEKPTDDFKAEGENYMMGYCFGADYIVVYRCAPEGDQLLGNSSTINPAQLHGRVHFNHEDDMLGLWIKNLTELDAGIYRKECWSNRSLASQHTRQLSVCKEEFPHEEITVNEEGGTELSCNNKYVGLPGVSVRWYHETDLVDIPVLFMDTGVSLKPLTKKLQGVVEPRNNGAVLVLDNMALKSTMQFYCLAIKGETCLSFKNMYRADLNKIKYSFASEGDRVVLRCNASDNQLQWATPLGPINSNSTGYHQMHISTDKSASSLIITAVTNQHSGMYSCISPLFEIQFSLLLCPERKSQEIVATEGENVSLECTFQVDTSHKVLWFRRVPSEQYEVLSDSEDHSVLVPKDLSGRLSLSHYEYMLNISNLGLTDTGVYGCVLLTSPGFINGDEEYDYDSHTDYDDESTTEYDYTDVFEHSERCIFKQETVLNIVKMKPDDRNIDDTSNSSEVVWYVVGGVAVLVAVVVSMIVIMKKKAASHTSSDTQMTEHPGVTDMLTGDDHVS